MSPFLKFSPEVGEVVDLAVEDHLDGTVLVADGLPAGKKIYDAQASVAKTDAMPEEGPLFIRPSMGHPLDHPLQGSLVNGAVIR